MYVIPTHTHTHTHIMLYMYMYMYIYIYIHVCIYIVAVCDVLQAPAASITAGIAADNLVVAIFFITLFAIANQVGLF